MRVVERDKIYLRFIHKFENRKREYMISLKTGKEYDNTKYIHSFFLVSALSSTRGLD